MTKERQSPIAKIGDTVVINSAKNCKHGYAVRMSDYTGCESVVKSVRWIHSRGTYGYLLDIDGGRYVWCDNCIERIDVSEIEESDAPIDALFGGVIV